VSGPQRGFANILRDHSTRHGLPPKQLLTAFVIASPEARDPIDRGCYGGTPLSGDDQSAFQAMAVAYWNYNTPIGYVFNFGVMPGLVVGAIIVYQILFSDVQDHLKESATLKAIGVTDGYLCRAILQKAAILAVAGFLPAILLTWQLFKQAGAATNLPPTLSPGLGGQVSPDELTEIDRNAAELGLHS
jgi:hypothetical protein